MEPQIRAATDATAGSSERRKGGATGQSPLTERTALMADYRAFLLRELALLEAAEDATGGRAGQLADIVESHAGAVLAALSVTATMPGLRPA